MCGGPSPPQNPCRTWPGHDLLRVGSGRQGNNGVVLLTPADTSGQWPGNRFETSAEYTGTMSEPDWAPLTGFRVAVTSARRADELSALLRRRGATVFSAAAIAMVPLPDDDHLRKHTEALIDTPPDVVIATTGIGFRGWIAAADGWGLGNGLITAVGKASTVAR